MINLLRWLLGSDASPDWVKGGEWHIEFHSLPDGGWAVVSVLGLPAAVAGVWWLYRREGRELRLFARLALAGLRLLVVSSVAFMLLEMVVVWTKREPQPSHLLVLVDASESMGLQDPYTDEAAARELAKRLGLMTEDGVPDLAELRKKSRLELAQRTLPRLFDQLADGRVLSGYSFASNIEPLEAMDAAQNLRPSGPVTAIGDAIKNALAGHRGQPLAGVLLVTDGQSNAGDDAHKVAEQAAKEGVPISTLAVGTLEGPRNTRLADIETSPVVFVRDPVEIGVLAESRGLKGTPATVTLEVSKDGSPWEEVGREAVTLGEDAVLQRTTFRFTPEATGPLEFRAQVSDAGPELTTADNSSTKSVKVIRQKIRVLLIAGGPSPEVQFLRNALLRDTALEFASWLQTATEGYEHVGHRPIRRLPATQEELDRFDVLILFDPDMRKLGPTWPDMLTKFVGDAGGGIIYVAGEQFSHLLFGAGSAEDVGATDNAWIKILPVVRDPSLYQSTAEVRLSARQTYTLELTPEGTGDPIFRFAADPSRNREVLTSLPGMYWHFPVTRAKPAATVLARHGDPRMTNSFGRHVIMATQLYGPGRTVFVGFDSTYRWRYLHEEYFDGFWARLADRVGRSKLLGGRHPFTLATDKAAYRVGDRVTLTARFVNASDAAAALAGLNGELQVTGEEPQPVTLEPAGDEPGAFRTTLVANQPGQWSVRVTPGVESESETGPRPATLTFRVEPGRQELDQPALNRALLDDIARASGGQTFLLAEADRVPDAFKIKQVERVLEFRDEIWDAPLVYVSVLCLLTAEWLLRKRYRMA